MKKTHLLFCLLIISTVSFSQVVRDHRNGKKTPYKPASPAQPPPVAGTHRAGPAVTTIDPNKWYYIKRADTKKYMMIAGHKDPTRSLAILAIEEMQQDNTSQQWRFVAAEENGSAIYKLQNRKYTGFLMTLPRYYRMEFRRDQYSRKDVCSFIMVPNPDKTWYILTRLSGNKYTFSTTTIKQQHCSAIESDPLIGGRVIYDYECVKDAYREYVNNVEFTGKSDQKWVLEEVRER